MTSVRKAKHGKPATFTIPRGPDKSGDIQPMTGMVTSTIEQERAANARRLEESRQAVMSFVSRRMASMEDKLDMRTDIIMQSMEELWDEVDKLRKTNKHLWEMNAVIVFYLLAWLVGWGMGAW